MPKRIAALPVHENGYPIPFFVYREPGQPIECDCAEYALQVCPYLGISQVQRRETGLAPAIEELKKHFEIEAKPDRFGCLVTRGWKLVRAGNHWLFQADPSTEPMTWWKDGRKL